MTLLEILLSAFAAGISGGAIGYTLHAVRSNAVKRPTEAQIKHMIEAAPPDESGNESTR